MEKTAVNISSLSNHSDVFRVTKTMNIIQKIESMGHEQVALCQNKETGLNAIIAIHDTTLGPSLGGCRFWNYKSQDEALFDVLRLSRGMTYKAAITGLELGGGKSVLIGDPQALKSREFFHSFGEFVDSLQGKYITAEDVNITVNDMNIVREKTQFVAGFNSDNKGSGDPSPFTALGVFQGIKACIKFKHQTDNLKDFSIAVQGCGAVGSKLSKLLHEAGANLIISDIDENRAKKTAQELNAEFVAPHKIHQCDVDIFAPCALGGILNKQTIPEIKAKIIAGGANNQLLNEKTDALKLQEQGILYAPDYVINAGGLINVYGEIKDYNSNESNKKTLQIYESLLNIFKLSEEKDIFPLEASNQIAEQIIKSKKDKKNS